MSQNQGAVYKPTLPQQACIMHTRATNFLRNSETVAVKSSGFPSVTQQGFWRVEKSAYVLALLGHRGESELFTATVSEFLRKFVAPVCMIEICCDSAGL